LPVRPNYAETPCQREEDKMIIPGFTTISMQILAQ
jgi:hypothetical protein